MADDNDPVGRKLGDAMAKMEIPPVRLEIDQLLQAGRARVRRRRAAAGTLAGVAVLASAGPVAVLSRHHVGPPAATAPPAATGSAPPRQPARLGPCTVTALPLPAVAKLADVTAMDPSGRYVVADTRNFATDSSPVSVLWTGGVPSIIPVDGTNSFAYAVNSSGTVVGTGIHARNGPGYPWIYRGTAVTALAIPTAYRQFVTPVGINIRGDVVGIAVDSSGETIVAVVWPATAPGSVQVLDAPAVPGVNSRVLSAAIADDGSVVATVGGSQNSVPYRWDASGNGAVLTMPTGMTVGTVSSVRGEWAFGSVTQTPPSPGASAAANTFTPVRWNLRTGDVQPIPAPITGVAVAGNTNGDTILDIRPARAYPVYVHGGQLVDLPTTVTGGTASPRQVDESGTTVVGNVYNDETTKAGIRQPVVWHC